MSEPVRVLIVEDHRVLADALAAELRRDGRFSVVGIAADAATANEMALATAPEVVLMDVHLGAPDGVELARTILRYLPAAAIVMLSADDSDATVAAAVEAGAVGYFVKTEPITRIIDAVDRAGRGELLIAPATLARVLARTRERTASAQRRDRALSALSRREREVLALLAEGMDNPAIAERLGIGVTTVRSHVQSMFTKLDVHSKLELLVRALRDGIIRS